MALVAGGPSIFLHFMFSTPPKYSLRGGVGDIYHHTHSVESIRVLISG